MEAHDLISFDGGIKSAKVSSIFASGSASLYGKGVFTTIAIYDAKAFLWEKHWQRLVIIAEKLKIDLSEFSESVIKADLDEIIQKNNITNGRARITFFDESPSEMWLVEMTQKTSLLITTGDLRPLPENFALTFSPYTVNSQSPLAGVKSCNYLEHLMAHHEGKQRGFDEAIRLNENGHITSASMANVFWLQDGKLLTPALSTGCLPGTTREFVIESVDCEQVEAGIDEIENAEAVFLTSAGLGVVAVAEFESRKLEASNHAILDLVPGRR